MDAHPTLAGLRQTLALAEELITEGFTAFAALRITQLANEAAAIAATLNQPTRGRAARIGHIVAHHTEPVTTEPVWFVCEACGFKHRDGAHAPHDCAALAAGEGARP